MRKMIERNARRLRRLVVVSGVVLSGLWRHRRLPPQPSRAQCAEWLHETCARGLQAIDVKLLITGEPPHAGLAVSNHLSYLDILAYSAAMPCVFVSKAEVEHWPVFGRYARWAGSVFVRRHDRADAARANESVSDGLHNGVPIVLFPEGMTTDGERVLRFHSTMLQPAIDAGAQITTCALTYELDDGDPAREVCWWGEMGLLKHAWNLLGKSAVRVRIAFAPPMTATGERKHLSQVLHQAVVSLHDELRANRTATK